MDCLFCKIIKGEIPALKLYENEYVLAFLDINPDSDGHTLIIPKNHYKDIDDIDEFTITEIFKAAKIIKKLLTDKLDCMGFSLVQNNGDVQEIKHYHLHIKPYYKDKKNIEMIKHEDEIRKTEEIFQILKED